MEVDYDIVKTVHELEKQGHNDDEIEEKLIEMGYSQSEIKDIEQLAGGVDAVESEGKAKKVLIALFGGFVVLVLVMAVYAIFLV